MSSSSDSNVLILCSMFIRLSKTESRWSNCPEWFICPYCLWLRGMRLWSRTRRSKVSNHRTLLHVCSSHLSSSCQVIPSLFVFLMVCQSNLSGMWNPFIFELDLVLIFPNYLWVRFMRSPWLVSDQFFKLSRTNLFQFILSWLLQKNFIQKSCKAAMQNFGCIEYRGSPFCGIWGLKTLCGVIF